MKEKLKEIELFLFDMDGTIYRGDELFEFTPRVLEEIKQRGKRYMFMTNNAQKSVVDYAEKLKRMGITATAEDFVTSGTAMAQHLGSNFPNACVYVCGTKSFKAELRAFGVNVTEDADAADTVVVSGDTELTFERLNNVCRLLSTRQINYFATNPDITVPTEYGCVPDCGSFCQIIENATGRQPQYIGKPNSAMPNIAMQRTGCTRENTAVIGDLLYTDILCGINSGCFSVLVLSGNTSEQELLKSDIKPDAVLRDISEIFK